MSHYVHIPMNRKKQLISYHDIQLTSINKVFSPSRNFLVKLLASPLHYIIEFIPVHIKVAWRESCFAGCPGGVHEDVKPLTKIMNWLVLNILPPNLNGKKGRDYTGSYAQTHRSHLSSFTSAASPPSLITQKPREIIHNCI